jgi:uncharacterized protein
MPLDALSPTVITGWLECEHSLTLRMRHSSAPQAFGPFADLVRDKGNEHEEQVLARYEANGLSVVRVPDKGDLRFEEWAAAHRTLLDTTDADVVYQMPLVFEGIKGVADFLIRVDPEPGFSAWEPVDAKLARKEAKPGHLLQLCFYADAVASLTDAPPKQVHVELGSGERESYRFEEFGPYWRRMKLELGRAAEQGGSVHETKPEPCRFCEFCDFQKRCEEEWRAEDSLVFVASLLKADRQVLVEGDIATLEGLATAEEPPPSMPLERFERVAEQAKLQKRRRDNPRDPVPITPVSPGDDPIWGHGYSHLPKPDEGDVFFDLEGHPLFTAAEGIFFLFGLWLFDGEKWSYEAFWAHDLAAQTEQAIKVVEFFAERRKTYPEYHVYHYNHTERSSLNAMVADTEASVLFAQLAATGLFVDLLTVVRNSYQMGIESYGLKDIEQVTGFDRTGEIHAGSGAVLLYEQYRETCDVALLDEIALYNQNDVRSTMALRDWLIANRPGSGRWRDAVLEEYDNHHELDELSFRLLSHPPGSIQHLMGNLVGYWRRERSAQITPLLERARQPVADLIDDEIVVTALSVIETHEPSVDEEAQKVWSKAVVTWPEQALDEGFASATGYFAAGADGEDGFCRVSKVDLENRQLTIAWSAAIDEPAWVPVSVIGDDWVSPKAKQDALIDAGQQLLRDPSSLPTLTADILRKAKPRFVAGGGPQGGLFSDDKDEMVAWAPELDRSIVAVQGPPGTGKTYRGARMIRRLLQAGKRVGITAPSYSAFGNLMEAVVRLYLEEGDIETLSACQRIKAKGAKPYDNYIDYSTTNSKAAKPQYQLTAGTPWFFCGKDIIENPVDYLIVDEAGQMSLADVASMSLFAGNIILLGDPLQLDQVANAVHPEGSGMSSLEYMLDGEQTIAADRGVFIEETRRMHPDICRFISSQIYEDRLHSHVSCAQQVVGGHGSGLRWMEARHQGNVTEATEEAEMIAAKILELLGAPWTDQHGNTRPLTTDDFMVVAPYNKQKDEIRRVLAQDPRTAGVAKLVGTVDKFQGREAPIVFFSMTTSDGGEISRGADFLFSRSRLNVAVSRARSLAYLVCTDALLGTKASTIEGMRLIGTLNSFVEEAVAV